MGINSTLIRCIIPPYSLGLHVVLPHHRHPNQRRRRKQEREELRQAERHAPKNKRLAREVSQRNHVRPDGNVVHGSQVEVIRSVQAHDARNEGPGAKAARREGGDLVRGALVGCRGRGNELVDGVFGGEGLGRGREGRVADEEAVVGAAGVVEGYVVLGRVSDGDERELGRRLAGGREQGVGGGVGGGVGWGAYEEHVVRQDAVGGREPGSEGGEHGGGVVSGLRLSCLWTNRAADVKTVPDGPMY